MDYSPLQSLNEVIRRLDQSLKALSYQPSSHELERWAMVVVDSMSGPSRLYHRADHILDLSADLDPIGVLAALYHDIVYYQVDGGLPVAIQSKISRYFNSINGVIYTTQIENDINYDVTLRVFGFKKGQKLFPFSGQNEFLSALVAMVELEGALSLGSRMFVAACIEATIPFRGDQNVMEELFIRMKQLNQDYQMKLSDKLLIQAVKRAVTISNKDVGNFADDDVGCFLDNTWKLLPESNARLNTTFFYTIREYRIALQKMESFMGSLEVQKIFHQFKGFPSQSEFNRIQAKADENLKVARIYMKVKLYAMVILECLSHESGGDAPLIYFMGELHQETRNLQRMENFLLETPTEKGRDINDQVLKLLEKGRKVESNFDRKTSPLSAFLYKYVGDSHLEESFQHVKSFGNLKISRMDFLRLQNIQMISQIAQACAKIAFTRSDALLKLVDSLKKS